MQIDEVTDDQIRDAFDGIAHDLLAACEAAGEKGRIHIGDAADATFNALRLSYTKEAFPRIKEVLRRAHGLGRKQYILL
jgi:hypothetical protein